MNDVKIESLKIQISNLRTQLSKSYCDSTIPRDQVLKLSKELDVLLVEYHKLQKEE